MPAYPLWSDSAGKMRYVRTPHNQPIVFDKSTQTFEIPPNTRFYKTFLKQIVDINGSEAYRKIETRLIVSRPDTTAADGTIQQNALFGTYIWNDTETAATLQQDPLRDGSPFSDRLITYNTDEPRAAAIQASTPANQNLDYALDTASPPVRRHYAIPGSERCIQCHMGSASASFVLGFLPVQIATHPPGQSGVIEPATGDELTQLQRLIDYNVITGISSPATSAAGEDAAPAHAPQRLRAERAGLHGRETAPTATTRAAYPTTKAPVLKDLLDFLPAQRDGGIFQFPLDRTSPLRARGVSQDIPIPYITPSLRDIPEPNSSTYKSKYVVCTARRNGRLVHQGPEQQLVHRLHRRPLAKPHLSKRRHAVRLRRRSGDLSAHADEHARLRLPGRADHGRLDGQHPGREPERRQRERHARFRCQGRITDYTPQPYTEVLPSDPAYASAQAAAAKRLAQYHAGHRYNFCPDTSDIVDPDVTSGVLQTPAAVPVFDNSRVAAAAGS